MRSLIENGALALFALTVVAVLPAQTITQPGQVASSTQNGVQPPVLSSATSSSVVPQKSNIADVQGNHTKLLNTVWIASMFAAVGASTLDAVTSWGKMEGNPLLASSNGTFGVKGATIKAGIASAVIVPQILLRKHREMKAMFASADLGEAAIFSGVAVHNMGVRAPAPH